MEPLLYLSLYFKQHRNIYYESLQRVRFDGDWEQWLRFFMQGVLEVSQQAVETADHFHPPIKNPSDDGLSALAHPGRRI